MRKVPFIFRKFFFVSCLVFPFMTNAQTTTVSESAYRELLLQLIDSLQQQILLLQEQLRTRADTRVEQSTVLNGSNRLSSQVDMIAVYPISGPDDVATLRNGNHRDYFGRVLDLFPDKYVVQLGKIAVYDSDSLDFDAFVETIPPQHNTWLYAVSESMVEDPYADWNTELIVHELAHIVSYENTLGEINRTVGTCDSYFELHACPAEGSYLAYFVENFWDKQDLARAKFFADINDDYENAYDYYRDHKSSYVTDYAVVAPEEDFAESFMYFMLDQIPIGSIAKQKVDFFRQYSQLIKMRSEIREVK